jgi:hypothetical protein
MCPSALFIETALGPPELEKMHRCFVARTHRNALHDDEDIKMSNTSTPTHNQISGPITQARARQLNYQVTSFLASYSSYLDNENVHSLLLLRNDGHEGNRVGFTRVTFRFQNSSIL